MTTTDPRNQDLGQRWFRFLMRCLPSEFGTRYGDELNAVFVEMRDELGENAPLLRLVRFYADVTFDVIRRARQAHVNAARQSQQDAITPMGASRYWSEFRQDFAYGMRGFTRAKAFAAVAVVTLGLGVGANAAVFSLVNAVLLQPLPFDQADDLVAVWQSDQVHGGPIATVTPGAFRDWETQNEVFESIAAGSVRSRTVSGGGAAPDLVRVGWVTTPFFDVFRVVPVVGRFFDPADGEQGNDRVAVLSHDYWRTRFASDPAVPGRTITLDRVQVEVVGVAPPEVILPLEVAIWVPAPSERALWENRGSHFLWAMARLRSGVALDQARANIEAIADRALRDYPSQHEGFGVTINPLQSDRVGDIRPALLMLQGAALVVLLIACVNLANLLLARSNGRTTEFGVRRALGAGRGRLVRQVLTESLLLAACGAALGVGIAAFASSLLANLAPAGVVPSGSVTLHPTVLLAAVLAALGTSAAIGVVPALRSASPGTSTVICANGRHATKGGRRLRETLVVAEVALSLLLLVGAGLLVRSFVHLLNVDPGIETQGVLSARAVIPQAAYSEPKERADFFRELHETAAQIPGVVSAGLISNLPVTGGGMYEWRNNFTRPDRIAPNRSQWPSAMLRWVSPGYFETVGLRFIGGRSLTYADTERSPNVMLIDETLAAEIFPGENPLGQRLIIGYNDWEAEIVGIVGDVRQASLDQELQPHMYVSFMQTHTDMFAGLSTTTVTLRSNVDPIQLAGPLREAVLRLDPHLPLTEVQTLQQRLSASVRSQRFSMMLVGVFAVLALALTAVGLYGVISYLATQQKREFGIRLALGALERNVLTHVLRHGVILTAIGIVIGIGGVFAASRLLDRFLFDVSPLDPITIGSVCVLLSAISMAAMLVPARRASSADPVDVLRSD